MSANKFQFLSTHTGGAQEHDVHIFPTSKLNLRCTHVPNSTFNIQQFFY